MRRVFKPLTLVAAVSITLLLACESSSDPAVSPDTITITAAMKKSMDSVGALIKASNPTNADLQSLVDSTLQVLAAGVTAKRIDVTTNLTTSPLYFVGVHRAVSRSTGSFSTWTLVGFDDPARLSSLVEVAGFSQNSTATPPSSVTATIGDGSGLVNGRLMQVGANGAVTTYIATSGPVTFTSSAPGAACPGTFPSNVTCALETTRARFTLGGAAKTASQTTDVDVPALRLSYTAP